jgi:cation-transporting ATPase 13A3/4/5
VRVESFILSSSNIATYVVAVQTSKSNKRFFEFECQRYVLNPSTNRFEPFEWDFGKTDRAVQALGNGLTSVEAFYRLELVGRNEIQSGKVLLKSKF